MQRRYFPIAAIVTACLVIAVTGYAISTSQREVPARIVLDNTGGRVIFAHKSHIDDYGLECTDCHHDGLKEGSYLPCGTCHPVEFNEEFLKTHQKNFPDNQACLRCHDTVPTGPLAEDERPDTANIPLRAEAFHTQCMGCHEQTSGPYGDESCRECHSR